MTDDTPVVPLSRFRARLARPRASRRIDELISTSDPAAAVAALSVPELYFLVKEVGLVDCAELLALATPEQFQGCLDLEIWDRDRVQDEAVLPWLEVLAEAGFEKLGEVWRALDPELAALTLARHTRIFDLSLGEEPPDESELPRFETPDRFFSIELISERDDDARIIHSLIADLYRDDMVVVRHAIMSARSELPSELEEMSYRWRSGRLADLGYADFYEALEVFRPLDPDSVEVGEGTAEQPSVGGEEAGRGPSELPVPMLEQLMGRAFLARALGEVSDAVESQRLEAALIVLVNRVLAAARVSPGDEEAVVIGTEHATATLALGLEVVSRGNLESASKALRSVSLTRLHRVGYTVSLQLARAARQLAPRASSAGEPSASVLEALLRPRPFFARVLETPPAPDIRPFETLKEIGLCAAHLRTLGSRIAVATALGADLVAAAQVADATELDAYGRTAVARLIIEGQAKADALTSDELATLIGRIGEVQDRAPIAAALVALVRSEEVVVADDEIRQLADVWFDDIVDELDALDPDDIDPRYVTVVRLRAAKD